MATDITIPGQRAPALYYLSTERGGEAVVTAIDREALDDPRERALCRALLMHALRLLDASEPTSSARSHP